MNTNSANSAYEKNEKTVDKSKYSIYVLAQSLELPNFLDRCDTVINSPSKLTA